MSSANRLALSGVVDDLSVAAPGEGPLLIAAAASNFIGRWWTGSVAVAARDPASGDIQLLAESALRAGVAGVAWLPAPDGQPAALVTGSDDGSVNAWRYKAGEAQLRHQHGSVAHDDLVTGISALPGGGEAAAASSSADGSVKLWAASGGALRVLSTLRSHVGRVHSVSWGSAAQELVSASQDRTAVLWDARSKSASIRFSVRQPAHCAAIADDLGAVLVGDECGEVTVFDRRRSSAPLYGLKTHTDVSRRLTVSKAGGVASGGDDGRICIMQRLPGPASPEKDPQIDVRVLEVHGGSYVRALAWSDDVVISGGWDGDLVGSPVGADPRTVDMDR